MLAVRDSALGIVRYAVSHDGSGVFLGEPWESYSSNEGSSATAKFQPLRSAVLGEVMTAPANPAACGLDSGLWFALFLALRSAVRSWDC